VCVCVCVVWWCVCVCVSVCLCVCVSVCVCVVLSDYTAHTRTAGDPSSADAKSAPANNAAESRLDGLTNDLCIEVVVTASTVIEK
jgi:hypothetical protein